MKLRFGSVGDVLIGGRESAALLDTEELELRVPFLGYACIHDFVFYLLLVVWLCVNTLGTSMLSSDVPLYRISTIVFVLIVANDLILDFHSRADLMLFVLLGIIVVNAHRVGNTPFGMNILIVYCARHVDFRKVVLVTFTATAASVLMIVGCCKAGILRDVLVPRGSDVRHSLGFAYTTYLSHYCLDIALGYFFLRKDRYTYGELGITAIVDLLVYRATDSRSSFLLLAAVLVVLALVKMMRDAGAPLTGAKKLVAWLAPPSFALCALLAFAVILWVPVGSSLGAKFDSALSGRLKLSQDAYETHPVQAFGNEVRFSGWSDQGDGYMVAGHNDENGNFVRTKYSYVDSSYLQTLIVEGWLPFAVELTLLTVAVIWLLQREEYLAAGFMAVFAVHAIIDPQMHMTNYCCLLFAACRRIDLSGDAVLGQRYVRAMCGAVPAAALAMSGAAFIINYGIPVVIDKDNFPDAAVRTYVSDKVDVDGDGKLTKAEAASLTSMSIGDAERIEGLDRFPNLTYLRAYGTKLSEVNLSGASQLVTASFSGAGHLEDLTLGGNDKLTSLDVRGTALEAIDLSGAPAVDRLACGSDVDVTGSAADTYLVKSYSETDMDADGQASKRTVKARYDKDGRLVRRTITGAQDVDMRYTYDEDGRLKQVKLSSDARLDNAWILRYGDDGSLHAEGSNGQHVDRTCDASGREMSLNIKSQGLNGLLEARLEFVYDDYGMLTTVIASNDEGDSTFRVNYYSNGSLRSISSSVTTEVYEEDEASVDEKSAGGLFRNYESGDSQTTEESSASGFITYDTSRNGKDATVIKRTNGKGALSETVGTYHYEGSFPSPIWGKVERYGDGTSLSFDVAYEKKTVSPYGIGDVGNAIDFSDLTEPNVSTDYWLPEADLWWLVEHEVRLIAGTQDTSLMCSGSVTYYDDEVYAESNKTYDSCLGDALGEVAAQYSGTPSYAYYDIDGDENSELLIADGGSNLVRIYGQLQGEAYLSRAAADDETLHLSGNGFLVASRDGECSLEHYNGLRFDVVSTNSSADNLSASYPALQGIGWRSK